MAQGELPVRPHQAHPLSRCAMSARQRIPWLRVCVHTQISPLSVCQCRHSCDPVSLTAHLCTLGTWSQILLTAPVCPVTGTPAPRDKDQSRAKATRRLSEGTAIQGKRQCPLRP